MIHFFTSREVFLFSFVIVTTFVIFVVMFFECKWVIAKITFWAGSAFLAYLFLLFHLPWLSSALICCVILSFIGYAMLKWVYILNKHCSKFDFSWYVHPGTDVNIDTRSHPIDESQPEINKFVSYWDDTIHYSLLST